MRRHGSVGLLHMHVLPAVVSVPGASRETDPRGATASALHTIPITAMALRRASTNTSMPASSGPASAVKLPSPVKCGNISLDDQAMAVHSCLEELVAALVNDRSLVMPMYSELLKKRKAMAPEIEDSEADATFSTISTIGKLVESWMMNWLADKSPLSSARLLDLKRADDDAIVQLFCVATQLPPNLQCPHAMIVKQVAWNVAGAMHDVMGERLTKLQARNIVVQNSLNLQKGCYELVVPEGFVTEVRHIGGGRLSMSAPAGSRTSTASAATTAIGPPRWRCRHSHL